MKRERERKRNDNKFKTRSAGGEKGSEKTNKTKQTASRHAFLRGITVNDALLFPLPSSPPPRTPLQFTMLNVHQPFSLSAFASRWIADGTDAGTRTVSKEGERRAGGRRGGGQRAR